MSAFLNRLSVTLLDDMRGLWEVNDDLLYDSDLLKMKVLVPKGFATDLVTGPALGLISIARDNARPAGVLHDWLYSSQVFDRKTADLVLRESVLALGYSAATAALYYAAVRTFGWAYWHKHDNVQPPLVQARMRSYQPNRKKWKWNK